MAKISSDILELAIEILRPQVTVRRRLDQLGRDPDPVTRLPDAPLKYVRDAEAISDLRNAETRVTVGKCRGPRRDAQPVDPNQQVEQLFRQAVSEELLVSLFAEIRKWQHRDRVSCHGTCVHGLLRR
jgi:hypothetical protein